MSTADAGARDSHFSCRGLLPLRDLECQRPRSAHRLEEVCLEEAGIE